MRQHLAPVYVRFVLDDDVLAQHRNAFHSHPLTYAASPPDYATLQPRIRTDNCVPQNGCALNTHAVFDNHSGSYGYVWSDLAAFTYFGGGVN